MPDGFVFCFGSGLALHREGSQIWLQLAGEKTRHPLTFEQAERIRDDFDRTIREARRAQREEQSASTNGHGGETRGDG